MESFTHNGIINSDEKRLRSLFRIIIQMTLFLSALLVSLSLYSNKLNDYSNELVGEISFFVMGILSIVICAKFLDRRNIINLGFRFHKRGLKNFSSGFLLGAGIFSVLFVFELLMGWIEIKGMMFSTTNANFWLEMFGRLLGYFTVGILEESFSRGYQMKNISEGLFNSNKDPRTIVYFSLVISSLIFSFMHLANPGASVGGIINLILIGILFGYSYISTGSLAFPIGLHTAWNYFQGHVFGFSVSGYKPTVSLFEIYHDGPAWLTGGRFGPEGGFVIFVIVMLAMVQIKYFKISLGYNEEFVKDIAIYKRPI